ncbi:Uncharacterised protein [Vibrio cholerae]|nr:Uncharacterised protein [Vibrio cholerae]CSB40264.1 Uncharacterised protein [Vibrio cholerae]CSB51577.1 Uncharacterised protein [Vibrio cholerae]
MVFRFRLSIKSDIAHKAPNKIFHKQALIIQIRSVDLTSLKGSISSELHPILRILSTDELLQISFSPINQNQRYPNDSATRRLSK